MAIYTFINEGVVISREGNELYKKIQKDLEKLGSKGLVNWNMSYSRKLRQQGINILKQNFDSLFASEVEVLTTYNYGVEVYKEYIMYCTGLKRGKAYMFKCTMSDKYFKIPRLTFKELELNPDIPLEIYKKSIEICTKYKYCILLIKKNGIGINLIGYGKEAAYARIELADYINGNFDGRFIAREGALSTTVKITPVKQ